MKLIRRTFRQRINCVLFSLVSVLVCLLFLSLLRAVRYSLQLRIQAHRKDIYDTQIKISKLTLMGQTIENDITVISKSLRKGLTKEEILEPYRMPNHNAETIIQSSRFEMNLKSPKAYQILPHLSDNPKALYSSLLLSKGRSNVTFALGVPTIKRSKKSYLKETLQNIISNMNERERQDTVIIVFIGEMKLSEVSSVTLEVQEEFSDYISEGLVEIIAPNPSYYPDLNKLRLTLNNKLERVKWRSKQNLDYAYLMTYAYPKAQYYVQLEDDIITLPGFITSMKNAIHNNNVPWYVLDFCELGFIGKLFKSFDLPYLITFFQMFFNDKPVDWLLDHFIDTITCNLEKDPTFCKTNKEKFWIHSKPSLFQHVGKYSSFSGKVQRLKDKYFGNLNGNLNPYATVKSSIRTYGDSDLDKTYNGEGHFWGLPPKAGDQLQFTFKKPVVVKKFLFISENCTLSPNCFSDTSVEVLPQAIKKDFPKLKLRNRTDDGYFIVGGFDSAGVAQGSVDPVMGKIKELRLHVRKAIPHSVMLKEIKIEI